MKIKGLEGLSTKEINEELDRGGKFVMFQYTISILVMTFKRPSAIYFIKEGESAVVKGLPYTLISLFLGWWGFPWGPIYTIGSLITDLTGGKNITEEVLTDLNNQAQALAEVATTQAE